MKMIMLEMINLLEDTFILILHWNQIITKIDPFSEFLIVWIQDQPKSLSEIAINQT